jgi:predicted nucleotidyltransferase
MPEAVIPIPKSELAKFCRRWKVTELALFGSALRQDFHADSDIDLLVTFEPEATHSLFDLVAMQFELEEIFRRKVDLVERRAVEQSENYIRRNHILGSAQVLHVA